MVETIRTVGVIGAGVMGAGIAQVVAAAGYETFLFDAQPGKALEACDGIAARFERLVEKGKMSDHDRGRACDLLKPTDNLESFSAVDLVVEAIVEILEVKQQVLAAVEAVVGSDAIIVSNTSSLPLGAIAQRLARKNRFAGLHFFNPVPLMKVAEVIPLLGGDHKTGERLTAFVRSIGHTPVVSADSPGFIINHAGRAYSTEALRLLEEGVADPASIDRIMRAAGFRMGPFELFDLTGLDVSEPAMRAIYEGFYQEPRLRPSAVATERKLAGKLGRKTGEGFYRYLDGQREDLTPNNVSQNHLDTDITVHVDLAFPKRTIALDLLAEKAGLSTTDDISSADMILVDSGHSDLTNTICDRGLPKHKTFAMDPALIDRSLICLMASPASDLTLQQVLVAHLRANGDEVVCIQDSPSYVAQRMFSAIVNTAAGIVERGIASPQDLDTAVELGLGYPQGPLKWGDMLGPKHIVAALEGLRVVTGDPRYRPVLWLQRRAKLGMSLSNAA